LARITQAILCWVWSVYERAAWIWRFVQYTALTMPLYFMFADIWVSMPSSSAAPLRRWNKRLCECNCRRWIGWACWLSEIIAWNLVHRRTHTHTYIHTYTILQEPTCSGVGLDTLKSHMATSYMNKDTVPQSSTFRLAGKDSIKKVRGVRQGAAKSVVSYEFKKLRIYCIVGEIEECQALKQGVPHHLILPCYFSRGGGWGPRSALFCMLIAHVCRNGPSSSCIVAHKTLSVAFQLENGPLRHTCLIPNGVHPTFHSHISTSDHPLHQIENFFNETVTSKYHCKIIGVIRRSGWSDSKQGAKNGQSDPFHTWLSPPSMVLYHKEVHLWCVGA